MSIERFEAPDVVDKYNSPYGKMRGPEPRGEWVRYTDHKKEVTRLEKIISSQRNELGLQAKFREEDKHARQLLDKNACQRRVAELETKVTELEQCVSQAWKHLKTNHECEAYKVLATYAEKRWLEEWGKLERKATVEEMLDI